MITSPQEEIICLKWFQRESQIALWIYSSESVDIRIWYRHNGTLTALWGLGTLSWCIRRVWQGRELLHLGGNAIQYQTLLLDDNLRVI